MPDQDEWDEIERTKALRATDQEGSGMTNFTSRPPTPHELLVEAMAATAWETLTRDEGQWTDAIEDALVVAERDHLGALRALAIRDQREQADG